MARVRTLEQMSDVELDRLWAQNRRMSKRTRDARLRADALAMLDLISRELEKRRQGRVF